MSPDLLALRANLAKCLPPVDPDEAAAFLATQSSTGDWPDIDYADTRRGRWDPRKHLERTRTLALHWHDSGDLAHLAAALAGLESWLRRDLLSDNWWHNEIGNPRLVGEILLTLLGHVPDELLQAARPLMNRATREAAWTGANLLWISINRLFIGALYAEEKLIADAIAAALSEIRVSSPGEEGVQADFSFHQHGPLLHSGGYGASYLHECRVLLEGVHGTRWQPDPRYHQILAQLLLDGTRWMIRGGDYDPSCRDREITRPWVPLKSYVDVARFLAEAVPARGDELRAFADALARDAAPGPLEGNRLFFRSDFMVQQSAAAAISVRMHSARTLRAECCNSEGKRSHRVADGLTALMKTGAEYRNIFPVWDWQRLPGTTCAQLTGIESPDTVKAAGRNDSAGGVSDGRFGACTQLLENEHLAARQSWFFGPEGLVCLGAGIRCEKPVPVATTLDQSLRQGAVKWNGSPASLNDGQHTLADARWLKHGPWGFVLPSPATLTVKLATQSGAWNLVGDGSGEPVAQDVFTAWIDHGERPTNAAYAYAVIPDADRATLDRAAAAPAWQILANDTRMQAVWRPGAGLLQAMFFEAGELRWGEGWTLRVDRECAVMAVRDAGAEWRIYVADTRQTADSVAIKLTAPDGQILLDRTVPLPDGGQRGATVRCL